MPAALVVFDHVVSSDPAFAKYWLLQCAEEPTIKDNTATVALSKNGWTGKLVNTTVLPEADNVQFAKVGGPGKEFWVFGKNYPNETKPPDPEVGGWRVEVSPKRPAATDLFLNVLQVMDRSTAAGLPVEKISNGSVGGNSTGGSRRAIQCRRRPNKPAAVFLSPRRRDVSIPGD